MPNKHRDKKDVLQEFDFIIRITRFNFLGLITNNFILKLENPPDFFSYRIVKLIYNLTIKLYK